MALFRTKPYYKKATCGISYYGSATSFYAQAAYCAATTVGNYALFGGGYKNVPSPTVYQKYVYAYNEALTRLNITDLTVGRSNLKAATIGDYALFGGGYYYYTGSNGASSYAKYCSDVEAYNNSLTKVTSPTQLRTACERLAATTIGDYALFGGGYYKSGTSSTSGNYAVSDVNAYNRSLTKSTATALSVARHSLAATTIGDYALFGGGRYISGASSTSQYKDTVDAYNRSLTRSTATALSGARYSLAATTVGNYALFGGGINNSDKATVDIYDASLTKLNYIMLSSSRSNLEAATIGDYALFINGSYSTNVDVYDTSLTMTTILSSLGRSSIAATTIGNYVLVGGGLAVGAASKADVEVFKAA